MAEIIIDATNSIVGRIGTIAAKKALLGETVIIINAEKAVISGNKKFILNELIHRTKKLGTPSKGPFIPRRPDLLLKRMIRGMLPYRQERGKAAYKRIKCYVGIPEEFQGKNAQKISEANASKLTLAKPQRLEKLTKLIYGRTINQQK